MCSRLLMGVQSEDCGLGTVWEIGSCLVKNQSKDHLSIPTYMPLNLAMSTF